MSINACSPCYHLAMHEQRCFQLPWQSTIWLSRIDNLCKFFFTLYFILHSIDSTKYSMHRPFYTHTCVWFLSFINNTTYFTPCLITLRTCRTKPSLPLWQAKELLKMFVGIKICKWYWSFNNRDNFADIHSNNSTVKLRMKYELPE